MKRKYILLLTLAPIWIVLDQITKKWAESTLKGSENIEVIKGYFTLRYVTNRGAAWGVFGNFRDSYRIPFFILITIVATIILLYYIIKLEDNKIILLVALSSIFGGMIGNFIDRVFVRYVVDFIDWHYKEVYHWPTFNIADVAISVGMGLIILDWIVNRKDYKKDKKKEAV